MKRISTESKNLPPCYRGEAEENPANRHIKEINHGHKR